MGNSGEVVRWALWHPKLGFLTFGSRRYARHHEELDPRGCYSSYEDAKARTQETFYASVKHKMEDFDGSEIEIIQVELSWKIL